MKVKEYPYNTQYIIKDEFLDQSEKVVRNLETRKDSERLEIPVKWLSVKNIESDTFGWVQTEWIQDEKK